MSRPGILAWLRRLFLTERPRPTSPRSTAKRHDERASLIRVPEWDAVTDPELPAAVEDPRVLNATEKHARVVEALSRVPRASSSPAPRVIADAPLAQTPVEPALAASLHFERAGRWREAVDVLERAAQLEPSAAVLTRLAALLVRWGGDHARAAQLVTQAAQLESAV